MPNVNLYNVLHLHLFKHCPFLAFVSGKGPQASSGRGSHVNVHQIGQTEQTEMEYEFWPLAVYTAFHGDPATNGKNHHKITYKGQQGVAIFARPAGVVSTLHVASVCSCLSL